MLGSDGGSREKLALVIDEDETWRRQFSSEGQSWRLVNDGGGRSGEDASTVGDGERRGVQDVWF